MVCFQTIPLLLRWKLTDGFPVGMSVLVVDDDVVVLRMLEMLLLKCRYKVTISQHAFEALELLRANKDDYDLVISDVNMPDMDGFKLLEIVGLEMDLPVIMLSVDCDVKSVMKGIMHGAVDYLAKPVRLEELKLIWKHVAKKSLYEKKDQNDAKKQLDHVAMSEDVQKLNHPKKCKDRIKERDKADSADSDEDMSPQKKPRITWSPELHAKFISVVNQLGISRAGPKKILDMMNISGLTRENVSSHLQKYRKGLKKNAFELSQQLFKHSGTSTYSGSSFLMTANQQRAFGCSFDRPHTNIYKNMPVQSSYPPPEQSFIDYQVPSTWFSHPLTNQNNFCQQYNMNPQAYQLGKQHLNLTKNSYVTKASTQVLSYQSFAPRSSQLDGDAQCSQNPRSSVGDSSLMNSGYQLGDALDDETFDLFVSNNQLDNCSIELDAVLASDQEQQQFGSCLEADVETGAHINWNSLDVQSSNHDHMESGSFNFAVSPVEQYSAEITFAFNKVEHTDDLHAALKQFQR